MTPRARHLAEMRLALAEGLSLPAARHRLAALRLRAIREARAKTRGVSLPNETPADQPPAGRPQYWWYDL